LALFAEFYRDMTSKFLRLVMMGSLLGAGPLVADVEETPLHDKMEEVNRSLKLLRRAGDDYEQCVDLVQQAQTLMLECFAFAPYSVGKMPEGKEKTVAIANYKKLMAKSYQNLCDLEIAYLSGDIEKIDLAMRDVKQGRKDGHEEYIEED
jgi:hypothetical protein